MINVKFQKAGKYFRGKKTFPETVPITLFINILATCWLCIVHFSHICPQRTIKAVVTSFTCKETLMWIKSRRRKKKDGDHLQNSSRNLNLLVLTHSVSRYIFPWDKISETQKAISWYFYNEFLFWKSGNITMRLNLPSLYFICILLSFCRLDLMQEIQKTSKIEATAFSKPSKWYTKLSADHVM